MGLFDLFKSSAGSLVNDNTDLLTIVVEKNDNLWSANPVETDMNVPAQASLDDLINIVIQQAQAQPNKFNELQFAIYPFGNDIKDIYPVEKSDSGYSAVNQTSGETIEGTYLDELVNNVGSLPEPSKVLLQYVIKN